MKAGHIPEFNRLFIILHVFLQKIKPARPVWWHIPVIPELENRKNYFEFEANLDCTVNIRLARTIFQDPVSKDQMMHVGVG